MNRRPVEIALRTVAAVLLAICVTGTVPGARAASPSLRISGPEQKVFDSSVTKCGTEAGPNIPDTAPVAFRRADGEVVMLATNYPENFYFSGPALGTVQRTCKALLHSQEQIVPETYANRQWMRSVYTQDGKRVLALIHNEYQGWLYSPDCAKPAGGAENQKAAERCWWASITYAISEDGGRSFRQPKAPANVVAALPYRYKPNMGKIGIASPTSMVRNPRDGLLYVLVRAYGHRGKQQPGMCAMRGEGLDPTRWTAWGGKGFDVHFADPYTTPGLEPAEHVCTPVTGTALSTLVYSSYLGKFVAVGRKGGNIVVTYSDDIVHWSPPETFMTAPHKHGWKPGQAAPIAYLALLDPDSPSPSFDVIGKNAWLYFVRRHVEGRKLVNAKRDIMRVPVEFGGG